MMQISDVLLELKKVYPEDLVNSLIESYKKSLREYKKGNWAYCINEIGQFIEVLRRIICVALGEQSLPLSTQLPNFTPSILNAFEQKDKNLYDESYRIIIPRMLYSMYCIRSKRGAIHKNHIDPNKMDARILIDQAKWIIAELFRLISSLSFEETVSLVDSILVKEIDVVWNINGFSRIIDSKMKSPMKVLCLLYNKDGQPVELLQKQIEYKNNSDFRKLLRKLHSERKIEYSENKCYISPIGINIVEQNLKVS